MILLDKEIELLLIPLIERFWESGIVFKCWTKLALSNEIVEPLSKIAKILDGTQDEIFIVTKVNVEERWDTGKILVILQWDLRDFTFGDLSETPGCHLNEGKNFESDLVNCS